MTFVDRHREVRELRELVDRSGSHVALLYGRRRVGKTYLLQHAWRDHDRVFYYLAGNVTSEQNRQDLLAELDAFADHPVEPDDHPTWRSAFRALLEETGDEPLVVVLDEFQYLLGDSDQNRRELTSQLNAVWDRRVEPEDADVTLLLCGSEIGTMEGIGSGGPLDGRISWRHRLQPFDYLDASAMLPERGARESVYFYSVFGGMPEYLDAVRGEPSLETAVVRKLLAPRGEIHFQLERLLAQEQGLREPRKYRAVLEAVGSGCTTTNGIRQRAFESGTSHRVRRILERLEDLGLVRRTRNFRSGPKSAIHNRVADPAVRFWFRFVHPNRSRLERREPDRVWHHRIKPKLDTYVGHVFEDVAEQGFRRRHGNFGLPAPADWARWEGSDRNGRHIELDIAAELEDGQLLTGEVKWSSSPVDVDLHFDHRDKLRRLADAGRAWAHDALDPETSHGHFYLSAAGFTDAFRDRAAEDDRLHLADLHDLY